MKPVFYPRGHFPPVSNTERQREFRERNPGYYQRLHAKRRAEIKARAAQLEVAAPAPAPVPAPVIYTIPVPTWRLALPAPVVLPVLPALNPIEVMIGPAARPTPQPARRVADHPLAA